MGRRGLLNYSSRSITFRGTDASLLSFVVIVTFAKFTIVMAISVDGVLNMPAANDREPTCRYFDNEGNKVKNVKCI